MPKEIYDFGKENQRLYLGVKYASLWVLLLCNFHLRRAKAMRIHADSDPDRYRSGSGSTNTTVQCSIVQVQYSTRTVQYRTVQYSTVQYSTVQYSTVQYCFVITGPLRHFNSFALIN
jgi:hypothetical protein